MLSFPGPLPPVDKEMLKNKKIFSREYRNRRIGDFLKEESEDETGMDVPILDSLRALDILEFCKDAKKRQEIMDMLEISNNTRNFEEYIKPLITEGTILLTIPQKPNSPKQQYYASGLSWTKLK